MDDPYFGIYGPACRVEGEVLAFLVWDDARRRLWRWWQGEIENVLSFQSNSPLRDTEIVGRGDTTSLSVEKWR
jgi:hypothetical protein